MSSEAAYFPDALGRTAEKPALVRGDLQSSVHSNEKDWQPPEPFEPETSVAVVLEVDDEELLDQVRRGDREALGILFRRHARSVRNVAQRILRDEAEADDLLQDVFLFIFRKAALFDSSKGSARSWIFQVAYHRAFNRRQYLSIRHFYSAVELDEEVLRLADREPESPIHALAVDGILGKELTAIFLTRLSLEQRHTIELFFFEGYTLKEIAERTGQSLGNVRSYYYRGLERLRAAVLAKRVQAK